mmetsp:Transcript_119421/g.207340  ORF Transcript_119421/g.207340 Transcript_119421/m.207340 type:complete len:234 (+) Transcript_119421:86-787(+)
MSTQCAIAAIGLLSVVSATNNPSASLIRREQQPGSELQQAESAAERIADNKSTAKSATYHCHKGPFGKCWSFSFSHTDGMYHAPDGRHKNQKTFQGDSMENAKDWCINAHGNEFYDVSLEQLFGEGPCPVSLILEKPPREYKKGSLVEKAWLFKSKIHWKTNDAPILQSAILMDRSGNVRRTAKGNLVPTATLLDKKKKESIAMMEEEAWHKEHSFVDEVLKMKPGDKELKWH